MLTQNTREKVISLLERLISYNTVSDQSVLPMATFLAESAENMGFSVHTFETSAQKTNIIAQIGPQEDGVVFCGHMDVVPVDGQSWNTNPFKAHIEAKKVYGRGSCDMKGFFASTMVALNDLPLHQLKKGISLIWTHDEEIGCLGAEALVSQVKESDLVFPKTMLIGEPTELRICRMHGGHITLDVEIQGVPAHSSKPHLGCNSIEILGELIMALRQFQITLAEQPSPHPEMKCAHSLINLATVEGGTAVNILPERTKLRLGMRPMPGHSSKDMITKVEEILFSINKRFPQANLSSVLIQEAPPMVTPRGTLLEQHLNNILSTSSTIGVPFATDGGRLTDLGFTPLICGPGSIEQAHKANEFVSMNQLFESVELNRNLLQNWCF